MGLYTIRLMKGEGLLGYIGVVAVTVAGSGTLVEIPPAVMPYLVFKCSYLDGPKNPLKHLNSF